MQLLLFLQMFALIYAHSWMSCPPSFDSSVTRGGESTNVCEAKSGTLITTSVKGNDRLKVGWVSNNHGGGFVRISLVPEISSSSNPTLSAIKENVLKVACYGYDMRPGKFLNGDCNHPCNARGGCEYQSNTSDIHRYDTTVAIPTNLPTGFYILQWAALVGNGGIYNSCARIFITNDALIGNCTALTSISVPPCLRTAGGLSSSVLLDGCKMGLFCFGSGGNNVDHNIAQAPVNINCDPRASCNLAIYSNTCALEAPDIRNPTNPVASCQGYQIPINSIVNSSVGNTVTSSTGVQSSIETYPAIPTVPGATYVTVGNVVYEQLPECQCAKITPTNCPPIYGAMPTGRPNPNYERDYFPYGKINIAPIANNRTSIQCDYPINTGCPFSAERFFCYEGKLARCVWNKWVIMDCAPGTHCEDDGNGGLCVWNTQ